ncbi:MAG: glycosyltransferase family 39 protein [Planctomycetes bacterium]|nr:glycosyltransferase family 39 protein [Planctomycetota bacterium]
MTDNCNAVMESDGGAAASRLRHHALLLAAGLGLFFFNLGGPSLWDVDEGRNSSAALAMCEAGDWVVPTFNGALRVDKPVLLYWLQALSFHLLGIDEFAARLPSALAALLTMVLCYELGRRMFSAAAGLLAGLIAGSAPLFCAAARFANPDALLNLFTVLTLFLFWRGLPRPSGWWHFSLGLSMGFGTLAKGLIGFVLPQAVIVITLLASRQGRLLRDRRLLLGILGFCLAALPWHIAIILATKWEFISGFYLNHNVNRFLQTMETHGGGVYLYPAIFLAGFAPWSVFLPLVLWHEARLIFGGPRGGTAFHGCPDEPRNPSADPAGNRSPGEGTARILLWSWIGVYLVFFSLSATKLPNYILPIIVPAAILTGRYLNGWRTGVIQLTPWAWQLACAALLLVGVLASMGLLIAGGVIELEVYRGRSFGELGAWAPLGLLLVLGGLLAAWQARRGRHTRALACCVTSAVLLAIGAGAGVNAAFDPYKAPRILVQQSGACCPDQDLRIGAFGLSQFASLTFYSRRDVITQRTEEEALDLLRYPTPTVLFLAESAWRQLADRAPGAHVVARSFNLYRNDFVVAVKNQPMVE